jgi:hypothetical protein
VRIVGFHNEEGNDLKSINRKATVVADAEIEIAAHPETVWNVITDFNRWPEWNRDVARVSFSGNLEAGSRFQWKAGPGKITSTLLHVEKPRLLVWKGKTLGIKAIHMWRIEPRYSGVLISTEESWEGIATRFFRGFFQKMLQDSIGAWLAYLKDEAERTAEH